MTNHISIQMNDGRTVQFTERRKIVRSLSLDNGAIIGCFDFNNGETVRIRIEPDNPVYSSLAAVGLESKVTSNVYKNEDIEDIIEAVKASKENLENGIWLARTKDEFTGYSVLAKALIRYFADIGDSRTPAQIKENLALKSAADKMALRRSTTLQPYILAVEAEKNSSKVEDGDNLLADF